MAFTIQELHELEAGLSHATLSHGDQSFIAIIPESVERLSSLDKEFVAEIGYQSVLRYEFGLLKEDSVSGIYPTDDPSIVIVDGSVSNLLEIDSGHVLIDIYIQKGPEFVDISSEEVGGVVPELGSRVRVWLQGLKIYPSFK